MSNAVWVYLQPGFTPEEFFAWADDHDVDVVLLHLDGIKYADQPRVEPHVQAFITACINHNLQVHSMFNALTSVPEGWIKDQHRDLFCVDYHGISILDEPISGRRYFLDPNKADVVELVKKISANILQSYPELSGIQLDFIRYHHWQSSFTVQAREMGHNVSFFKQGNPLQLSVNDDRISYFLKEAKTLYNDPPIGDAYTFYRNFSYCFCADCLRGFASKYDITLSEELRETSDLAQWILANVAEKWYTYRSEILESVLREVYQTVKALDASKQLSITVWYNAPYGNELMGKPLVSSSVVEHFGQNWWRWVELGLVDFICPMNYWLQPESFAEVTQGQVAKMAGAIPLYSGLLRSSEYNIDAGQLKRYKSAAKGAGAQGICYFHYGSWTSVDKE